MGADLYKGSFEKQTGYFRDCYNSYGLSSALNFSWWRDVIPMLDDEGRLLPNKSAELLKIIESELSLFKSKFETKEIYKEDYANDIITQAEELENMLEEAIKDNEPIYCSL